LVPGFREVQSAAQEAGALGCSLSGSGPSIFALCDGRERAKTVADAMLAALGPLDLEGDRLVSAVGTKGVHLLD
jgi:homoserine kinase